MQTDYFKNTIPKNQLNNRGNHVKKMLEWANKEYLS